MIFGGYSGAETVGLYKYASSIKERMLMSPPPSQSTTRTESPSDQTGPNTSNPLKTRLDEVHGELSERRTAGQSQWIDCRTVDDRVVCERPDGRRVVVGPETIRTPSGTTSWTGIGEIEVESLGTEERRLTREGSQKVVELTPDRISVTEPNVMRRTYDW
jgi:hypothetical protein